jgi:hypothetical protein
MALTLLEANKQDDGDMHRAAIIEMFAANSDVLRVLPFEDVPGGSISFNQEGKLPGVAFRGFNESYSESVGILNPQVEVLKIAGGDLDVDKAILKTRGQNQRSVQEALKVKALSLYLTGKVINGDSDTDPRQFDGIRKRIVGYQLLGANFVTPGSNLPLSLEALDAAIDRVDNPTHLLMSKDMRRKLTVAARNYQVGGFITYTEDEFGKRVTMYNDLPILIVDYDDTGTRIIDFNEAGPAGGSTAQSLYVVSIGTGMLTGLQNGIMEVTDLGELQTKPVLRTRIEWLVGLAAMHGRCATRVWGITNAAVTAT